MGQCLLGTQTLQYSDVTQIYLHGITSQVLAALWQYFPVKIAHGRGSWQKPHHRLGEQGENTDALMHRIPGVAFGVLGTL